MQVLSEEKMAIKCPFCGSTLIYEDKDVYYGEYGGGYIDCPLCSKEIKAEKEVKIDKNTYRYPYHFFHTSTYDDISAKIPNHNVKEWIDEAIRHFEEHPTEFYWHHACGDTFVTVYNEIADNEYYIVVSKDFYELNIEK